MSTRFAIRSIPSKVARFDEPLTAESADLQRTTVGVGFDLRSISNLFQTDFREKLRSARPHRPVPAPLKRKVGRIGGK
jgi:hypothetical protein